VDANGARVMRYEPAAANSSGDASPDLIGGDAGNLVSAGVQGATIAGGGGTFESVNGRANSVTADFGTIGGGQSNSVGASGATVAGGHNNAANGTSAVVGGGGSNLANGNSAGVGGGFSNVAAGAGAWVGGGETNIASGIGATVPGGQLNTASGTNSLAAGSSANAVHDGAFVWADSSAPGFSSVAANEFAVRATGGVRFVSAIDSGGNPIAGVSLPVGGGAWSSLSDRNMKTNFLPIDNEAMVRQLAALPIESWSYRAEPAAIRHLGPTAQDFRAAFRIGEDDRHISTIDSEGVALAAIKGLYQMLEEKDLELTRERRELSAERKELNALKQEEARNAASFAARMADLERRFGVEEASSQ
jgi:hypothetical protein